MSAAAVVAYTAADIFAGTSAAVLLTRILDRDLVRKFFSGKRADQNH
jgi:hypothetical protein